MRDFESQEQVEANAGEPFQFSLRGQIFKAKPRMAPVDFGAWTELVGGLAQGIVNGNPFSTLSDILRNTLYSDFRKKWDKLMREDFDIPIEFNTLVEIGNAIMEHSAGRPTRQPQPSGTSVESDDTKSTDGSDSRVAAASTLSRSTQG